LQLIRALKRHKSRKIRPRPQLTFETWLVTSDVSVGMRENDSATRKHLDIGIALYAIDRVDEHFPARLCEKSDDFLVFRVKSRLGRGRKLVMHDEDKRTEIEVSYCRKCSDGGYELGGNILSAKEGAVRREWRLPADIPAQVTVVGRLATYKARVVNISPSGLGLQMPVDVPPGSELILQMRDGSGYGDVRHCRKIGKNKYAVGLSVHEFVDAELHVETRINRARQFLFRNLKRLWVPAYSRGH